MKHPSSTAAALLLMFLAAQVIGLLVVSSYVDVSASRQASQEAGRPVSVYEQLPFGVERPQVSQDFSFIFLSAALVIGTVLLLLVMRFRQASLWKLWFFLAIAMTVSISLSAFIPHAVAGLIAISLAFSATSGSNLLGI